MNLHENIHRLHQMMGVINENKKGETIRNLIDKMGVADAIKMVGNYYLIEPYLKEIDKVNFIKDKVNELCEGEFGGGGGFGLFELNEEPIHYDEDDNEIKQIEYLNTNSVVVDVYDTDMDRHLGNFNVKYENLPGQILDELVEILVNY